MAEYGSSFGPHRLRCLQLMEEFGIDPREVLTRDISEVGYLTRRRDGFGNTVIENEAIICDAQDWPKGFPIEEFMEQYHLAWQTGGLR